MKAGFKLFTLPYVIFMLLLALSAIAGCGGDGGSGDDLKKYVLTFDANGGEGEMEDQSADEGTETTLAENAFTRDGYDFNGWNTAKDGKGSDYADKATLELTENMTLYAQWKKSASETKISYTVKFDANGGTGEMKAQTAEEGTEIILTANAFTRDGYTFSGWAASADGNIAHKDEAKIKLTENLTLYAQWTEIGKVEKVTFSATGEIGYNEKVTLSCGTEGATIYYLLVSGKDSPTAEEILSSKQKYSEPIAITENSVIAAVATKDGMKDSETADATFTVKTYTVTFETEHGTAPKKIGVLKKGDTLGDRLPEPTAEGYRFDGWFNGETQFTAETEINSDVKLTAKWTKTYTVTFDANGGTGSIASITEVVGMQITLPENTLTKEGFEFGGWNTAKNMTGTSYDDGAVFTPESDLTLYAKWTVTADKVVDVIKSLEAGEHTFSVVGEINDSKLYNIGKAIRENTNGVEINLDLYGTTGLAVFSSTYFRRCSQLTGIVLPTGTTSIKSDSFFGDESLKSVVIPDGVESIGNSAFRGCTSLSEAVIPGSVKSIESHAFEMCTSLSEVVIPDSVTEIGNAAFRESGISSLKIGKGLTTIPDNTFQDNNLKKVTIPSNIESIGVCAFEDNPVLAEVVLEEGVKTIKSHAFYGCNFTSITIPKSVTSIEYTAFGRGELTVHYNGTVEEWEALSANIAAENLLNTTVHCSDGDYTPETSGE